MSLNSCLFFREETLCENYDGSFEGLLTIAFDSYVQKEIVKTYVQTDLEKANRILNGIINNISEQALHYIYNAYLSCDSLKEINILKYILNGFRLGPKIDTMLTLDYVFYVQNLSRKVWMETHRMKEFIRFAEYGNILYATIEPDNNVVEIIAPHFVNRLTCENFVIHDKKRGIAALYNKQELVVTDIKNINLPQISDKEALYEDLWKTFFNTIAVKERTNPRLQKQFVPKRYWNHMTEFKK